MFMLHFNGSKHDAGKNAWQGTPVKARSTKAVSGQGLELLAVGPRLSQK